MYSRMPRHLSTSQARQDRRGVYVPPNYSGTAIGMDSGPTPRFDDLPQVSNLPKPSVDSLPTEGEQPPMEEATVVSSVASATPANPLGMLLNSQHFPFGHGLGYEELFLLGLLLFLMKEKPDDAKDGDDLSLTLLLIGVLLFCG